MTYDNSKKTWSWLIGINIVLRTLFIAFVHPSQHADFLWYYKHAVSLMQGGGYHFFHHPTAYWPMGFPVFLSLWFRLTAPTLLWGLVANGLLSIAIVILTYALAKQLTGSQKTAFIAAFAYTLLPSQIEWNGVLGSEELFTCLILASLYVYLRLRDVPKWAGWHALLAGLIMGVACTVRPIPLLFPVFLLIYERWFVKQCWLRATGFAAIFGVGILIGICPVTIRNALVLHHFILVSTNGGVNMWQGTMTNGGYFWSYNPQVNPMLAANGNEILQNALGQKAALWMYWHHPWYTIRNGFVKWFDLYKNDVNVVDYTLQVMVPKVPDWLIATTWRTNTVVYWIGMLVALTGVVSAFRGKVASLRYLGLPFLFIIYNTAVFFFFPAWDRFRYPLMPLWSLFFAVGWTWLTSRWTRNSEGYR